mmetsp:Transcript_38867/g.44246  ORF Transcript_38867/g.44246 Transcript_38867/m.44246 type:complete len:170 (-) Transcript_38867:171-680(-)|eukprot:CAMPEP_0115012146 /NCGR_PEP_ID=MMETSP0216-20121206/24526_1 /TAXON_ID=223996 /ORGANISM="Protocruzia adherens, Strain Boccale" /LENGTH=169 /DNA_ID=CAMNT_0002381073 /DNA_START=78 /DNA_END=587 /DNA_ORIENTATION=+
MNVEVEGGFSPQYVRHREGSNPDTTTDYDNLAESTTDFMDNLLSRTKITALEETLDTLRKHQANEYFAIRHVEDMLKQAKNSYEQPNNHTEQSEQQRVQAVEGSYDIDRQSQITGGSPTRSMHSGRSPGYGSRLDGSNRSPELGNTKNRLDSLKMNLRKREAENEHLMD